MFVLDVLLTWIIKSSKKCIIYFNDSGEINIEWKFRKIETVITLIQRILSYFISTLSDITDRCREKDGL